MSRPVRTCVGCGGRANKSELLRLVWHDQVRVDVAQREPGRGAYLHRDPGCLDAAVRRRRLARALRVASVDAAEFGARVAPCISA